MEKECEQNLEWLEAQKIEISVDLSAAAKQHLHFLKIVDQNPWLYHGPILERAIYRYNAYWLPLLAKCDESFPICEGPLVPPFDCEWVWHCHRLNPVRYKLDCEQLYGRVLDNSSVASSTNGSCKLQTENLWKRLYPMEPYDLDVEKAISKPDDISALEKCTTYDLVSAVKRQSTFYSNISRVNVNNDIIVQEAVGRYKAFIYLTKRNHEKSINLMSVPTLDIDLIWHTHQLNPSSYYKDMEKIFGDILHHDDTDSDKDNSKKLNNVFFGTTAQWEETFGQRYWKSNAETPTVMIATKKHGAGAKCRAKVAENQSVDVRSHCVVNCVSIVAEKQDAGSECFFEAVEKHGACSKCRAKVVENHDVGFECFIETVEKHNAGARCSCKVDEKYDASSECFVETVEKTGACAKCRPKVAENQSMDVRSSCCIADCVISIVAMKQDAGSECFFEAVENHGAGARCCSKVAEKHDAGSECFVKTVEKHGADARCFCKVAKKPDAEKNTNVYCFAVVAEKNTSTTIYCRAVVAEKNGGCGNVMKNNANENAPLAEALNAVVAT